MLYCLRDCFRHRILEIRRDLDKPNRSAEMRRHGTPREQSPRILHDSQCRLRVSFCFELPSAALAEVEKSLKTMECVVGAIGIEPMTSPV